MTTAADSIEKRAKALSLLSPTGFEYDMLRILFEALYPEEAPKHPEGGVQTIWLMQELTTAGLTAYSRESITNLEVLPFQVTEKATQIVESSSLEIPPEILKIVYSSLLSHSQEMALRNISHSPAHAKNAIIFQRELNKLNPQ